MQLFGNVPYASAAAKSNTNSFVDKDKPQATRLSNITAGKAVADAVKTSLGPKGMDKMIQDAKNNVTISNDGATILKKMRVMHPVARMFVELSKAQDVEAGDGTTTVVIIAGSLLDNCRQLLEKGIHPVQISECLQKVADKSDEILQEMSSPIDLKDRPALLRIAETALNSKVVSQYSNTLAPLCVEAVLGCMKTDDDVNVDLRDIRIVKAIGGTVDDTELINGLVLDQKIVSTIKRVEKAKVGLIQFCISAPKTDMDNQVVVSDYSQMDRILKEERSYILKIVKGIKTSGCNVLLVQKSILRDGISDLALHFLGKAKIAVVNGVERDDIEHISKTLGCRPVASLDHMVADSLGYADLFEEMTIGATKLSKFTGISSSVKTKSLLITASNELLLEEADRSLHDALCVIRCLVKNRAVVAGGGAAEIELAVKLDEYSRTLSDVNQYCFRAFADAFEVVPYILADNAGMDPILSITSLRNKHSVGLKSAAIDIKRGIVADVMDVNVSQPLLVSLSAVRLAAETVRSILKIDDIINAK